MNLSIQQKIQLLILAMDKAVSANLLNENQLEQVILHINSMNFYIKNKDISKLKYEVDNAAKYLYSCLGL